MVPSGHIYPGQSRQGNDTFQRVAARNTGHFAENADCNPACIGRRWLCYPHGIPRSSSKSRICADVTDTLFASAYQCSDKMGSRKYGCDYKRQEKGLWEMSKKSSRLRCGAAAFLYCLLVRVCRRCHCIAHRRTSSSAGCGRVP